MSPLLIIALVILILLAGFALVMTILPPCMIFYYTLYRSEKKERNRECTLDNPGIIDMVETGKKWAQGYKDVTDTVHIVNDGLNLYGEYVNLGFDKCAVIIQGRTESLLYSYFFAELYAKAGYNILVIDSRAHGLSDGKYITAGIHEHRDVIKWIELIRDQYGIYSFVLHGICIGSATSIYAYCALKKENLIKKIVVDGLYYSYYEMFKYHIIERKKPVFCYTHIVFFFLWVVTGANAFKVTPYKCMPQIDLPILFLWSTQDFYCRMDKCDKLFEACASPTKEVQYFVNGGHSFVRYHNLEDYDATVTRFLEKNV